MLPDLWTLALAVVVTATGPTSTGPTSTGPTSTRENASPPSALQAEAADAEAAPDPAPEPPAAEQPAAEPPAAEQPPTDSAAGDPGAAPSTETPADPGAAPATAAFPDEPAPAPAPTASDPSTAPAQPRTWNDPEAAAAAAAADPNAASTPPAEEHLGTEPLEPRPAKDPEGFGMAMVAAITISPASGHQWSNGECPGPVTIGGQVFAPGCGATPPAGVSAEGRFGYMWGLFGAELYGQLATDYLNATLTQVPNIPSVPSYATQMHVGRLGIGGGGMARFKTPPGPFRLSAGAGVGFLYRTIFSNVSSLDGSFEDYVAPVLRADVGIVVVSALTIGIMSWVEFAETVTVSPDFSQFGQAGAELEQVLGSTVAYRGTQGFFGVFGGFAFGK